MQQQVPNPETCEGWQDFIRLPITDPSLPHEDLRRLRIILSSDHFGIVSPFRSYGMVPAHSIRKGDMVLAAFLGVRPKDDQTAIELFAERNKKAWTILWSWVNKLGNDVPAIPVSGCFREAGSIPTLEAAVVIPGIQTQLTKLLMVELARTFNQDNFIYAGPEAGEEVRLYEVSDRGEAGLPLAYDRIRTIGNTRTMAGIESLLGNLYSL